MKTIYILFVWLCAAGLLSACEDKEVVTTGSITGTIEDSVSHASLSGAISSSVTMEDQVQLSSYSGHFIFENLQSGRYRLTVEKSGYQPAWGEILVLGSEQQVPCSLVPDNSYHPEEPVDPTPVYPDVYVSVEHYFTLSDGIYFYFKPSAGVSYYFWNFWKVSEVPATEEKIINELLLDGVRVEIDGENEEGYGYNLKPNTRYRYYILAYNADKVRGRRLIQGEITTSSDVSQPVADIYLKNSVQDTVYLDVTRGSGCSSYYMTGVKNISSSQLDHPAIWWAATYLYDDIRAGNAEEELYTENFTGKWWNWPQDADNVILTWGRDSRGNLSGVLMRSDFRLPVNTHTVTLSLARFSSGQGKPMRVQTDVAERIRLKAVAMKGEDGKRVSVPFRN